MHLNWGGGYSKSEVDTFLSNKSDTSHTHTKSQITDFPSYGTTANTICEGNDSRLSDARTPTSHTHSASDITSGLATVATSGSYNDLSNKPTIPTVNNATLTIQKNGTTVKTFTANASSNVTANITVPTKVSELTNDNKYTSCLNSTNSIDFDWNSTYSNKVGIKIDNTWLGGILTTANTTVPTKVSQLTNDSGFLTSSGSCNYANSAGTASSATTSGAVSTVVDNGSTKDLVYALIDTDAFRIRYSSFNNDSWVEIATSDDGNEPIYVRQYSWDGNTPGSFDNIVRTLTLLDESGNTQFPGTVTASTFTGNLTGNCSGSAGSVAWNNVSGKPTIPTNTNELTNGAGFITADYAFPKSGGAITGTKITRSQNNDHIEIIGGTDYSLGPSLVLTPYSSTEGWQSQGSFVLHTNNHALIGYPNGTLTWDGQSIQTTSDQRLKQQISKIDNALLDAWQDVDLVQFKYNDAVDTKKDKARLHTGYVVQQIDEACKSHGVNISQYGLYCHEEYPEETEEVEVTQKDGTKVKERKVIREASEHYSLRYTEVYAVECAYLRREVSRLKQQNEDLEQRLKMLEQSVK